MGDCKHINITIKQHLNYTIPQGYWKFKESGEVLDFSKYFQDEDNEEVVCSDCGKEID